MKQSSLLFKEIVPGHIVYRMEKEGKIKVLLIIFLLACLYSQLWHFSLVMWLIFIPVSYFLFTKRISILDTENQRMKRGRVFRNYANGEWESLPEVLCVQVFRCTMVSNTHSITYRSIRHSQSVLAVNLIYDKNKKIKVYQTTDCDESMALGRRIALDLGVPLLDATTRHHVWVNMLS